MEPLVSVYCMTYNHERYIEDALEGFVSQKTNFPYEVIVHDDASTDNTTNIIKQYAKKYPDIIHPVYQDENQYSKHISITRTYIFPLLKGKYIACCEGDDYWCDENKLQRQVDWLEEHQDYSSCVHNTILMNTQTGKKKVLNHSRIDMDIPFADILQGGGVCFHTSSFMFRSEFLNIPDCFIIQCVGDYPRAIYMSLCGKVRYLHEIMSVYRVNVKGSFTRRLNVKPISTREKVKNEIIQMLENVDIYTSGEYRQEIQQVIEQKEFSFLLEKGDLKNAKKHYSDRYANLNLKNKIKLMARHYLPHIYLYYRKIRFH